LDSALLLGRLAAGGRLAADQGAVEAEESLTTHPNEEGMPSKAIHSSEHPDETDSNQTSPPLKSAKDLLHWETNGNKRFGSPICHRARTHHGTATR